MVLSHQQQAEGHDGHSGDQSKQAVVALAVGPAGGQQFIEADIHHDAGDAAEQDAHQLRGDYRIVPSGEEQQEDNDSPGGYRWTYHRTRRRGNFLVRLLGIYLLIQIVAMLFGSCGYRGAYYDPYYYRNYSYSDSGTYSGQSQSQTGSDTGSGSWY